MQLKVTLSDLFNCELDREACELLAEYPKMVEWWIERAEGFSGGSFATFRKKFYKEWKEDWKGYHSQHAQTSCLVAYSALQLWRSPAERLKFSELKWHFAVVSPKLVRIENGWLCFATKLERTAHVRLIPDSPRQKRLIEQAENGYWQIGQSIVTPEWTVIPFTRYVNLTSEGEPFIKELLSD